MKTRGNFFYLLGGLLFYVLVAPIAYEWSDWTRRLVVTIPLTVTMMLGVWSLPRGTRKMWFGMSLIVASIVLDVWYEFAPSQILLLVDLVIVLAFCAMTIAIALRDVLFGGVIDENRLAGSICIYLLLGLSWALVYAFVLVVQPDAFSGLDPDVPPLLELSYYSFVTLTTLGYGEITPVLPFARALAYLEAIAGVMYTTLLVAALVSAHLAARHAREHERED